MIACVQLPNLPIAVARRDRRAPFDRPLILYTVDRQRAVVYTASDDAGVSAHMPLRQAHLRCPQATFLLADPEHDRQMVATFAALMEAWSPRTWQTDLLPDAAVTLDLGKITFAQAIALIARLRGRIRAELGLTAAIGAGSNRLVARHAAIRAGVGRAVLVPAGDEATFLAPQPAESVVAGHWQAMCYWGVGADDSVLESAPSSTVGDVGGGYGASVGVPVGV